MRIFQKIIDECVDYEKRYYRCKYDLICLYGLKKGEKIFNEIDTNADKLSKSTTMIKIDIIEQTTNSHFK